MTETDWTAALREESLTILNRLRDRIAAGDHNGVRPAVYSGRWAETIEVEEDADRTGLDAAIQKTDDAHAALTRWPPDMMGAQRALDEAIQALG